MTQLSSKLPESCYVHIPGNPPNECIGIVTRGESGYHQDKTRPLSHEQGKEFVREYNEKLGVTPLQEQCMLVGSMWGWDVPGANPDTATPLPE